MDVEPGRVEPQVRLRVTVVRVQEVVHRVRVDEVLLRLDVAVARRVQETVEFGAVMERVVPPLVRVEDDTTWLLKLDER